jgi:hypothetical protein
MQGGGVYTYSPETEKIFLTRICPRNTIPSIAITLSIKKNNSTLFPFLIYLYSSVLWALPRASVEPVA